MNKSIKLVITVVLLFLFLNIKVNGATNYQYNVYFDYTCVYIVNDSQKTISSGKNVSEVEIPNSKGKTGSISIILKGNKNSSTQVLKNNGYLNSDEINIIVTNHYEKCIIKLLDSNKNPVISTGTNSLYANDLIEDTYYIEIECSGSGNNINGGTYEMYQTTCSFSFTIDTTPPVITGASKYMNGKYCRTSFSISGSDDVSGLKCIYMLEPGGSSYQNIGQGIKLSSGVNGVITFYAVDNAGNVSNNYYIYNDIEKPTGSIKTKTGTTITSTYTNTSFYYEGKDSYSGINYTIYKKPNSSNWIIYNGEVIENTSEEGLYQFSTIDKAGNQSSISSVYLNKKGTNIDIIHLDNSNKVYLTWNDDDYIVTVNSNSYNKNQIISDEGTYKVTTKDSLGNTSSFTFTINCYFILTKIFDATCITEGYSLYTCISCGEEKYSDYNNDGTHLYNKYYIAPTCTEFGGIYNYCIYCEENYLSNEEQPLNHQYITYVDDIATCDLVGLRFFECERCGIKKTQAIPATGHDFIEYNKSETNKKTIITYRCEKCHETKEEVIELKSILILNKINELINEYFKYIIYILISTSLFWSLFIGIKIILVHKKEEREKVNKLIINYIIGLIVIFIIILGIPYIIRWISSL